METTIQVIENNSPKLLFQVFIGGTTTAFDLTGMSVEFYLKTSRSAADNAASTVIYSTGGLGITVTNATAGLLEVQIAAAAIPVSGRYWYHLDAIVSGKRETLLYGPLLVADV